MGEDTRRKAALAFDGLASATEMIPSSAGVIGAGIRLGAELLRTIAGGIRAGRMDRDALLRVIDEHAVIRAPDFSEADKAFDERVPDIAEEEDTKP